VADGFGKIHEGTLIGDNLGNAIFANSGNGVVFDGSVRDTEGFGEIEGFNAFVRGWEPWVSVDCESRRGRLDGRSAWSLAPLRPLSSIGARWPKLRSLRDPA
jgi:hypothetical protein